MSSRVLVSVSATIGTSSMPLGLTTGSCTPRCVGSQSRLDSSVSCSFTSESMRGCPTLNWTVSTAMPGCVTE